ncbi:MAG: hypothetical protein KY475_00555 [Planctomycetes bacterium]|nr:hypothetical protein [Planctomycetota bacterium]
MERPRRATLIAFAATALAPAGWGVFQATLTPSPPVSWAESAQFDSAAHPPRLLDAPADAAPLAMRVASSNPPPVAPPAAGEHPSQPAQWEAAESELRRLPPAPTMRMSLRIASSGDSAWSPNHQSKPPLPAAADLAAPHPATATAPVGTAEQERRWAGIESRATSHVQQAISLAERGAHYTARTELIRTLRLVAQSLDAHEGSHRRIKSLAAGLRALEEGEDFLPTASQIETTMDLESIVAVHRTPVLKDADVQRLSPLDAMQAYYTFAQEQMGAAVNRGRAGSFALFALGKLHAAMGQTADSRVPGGPKAMVYHQAATLADPENYLAANELGVLLARCEQWEDARRVLSQSVGVHPTASSWHNLAVVHDVLGEHELASLARREMQQFAENAPAAGPVDSKTVQWLTPEDFAKTARPDATGAPLPSQALTPSSPAGAPPKTAWWKPWTWTE